MSGQYLDHIFEDAGIGKLGAIRATAPEEMPGEQLWVISVIEVAPTEAPFSAFEQESFGT